MHSYFIGISVSELQQWLADDVLPVLTGRLARDRMHAGAASSGLAPESLFGTLPAFAQDDPAGVLIAEVSGPGTWGDDENPGIRCLLLSGVKNFIPLTEDARTALTLHLAGTVVLSQAKFEHEFTHFRISRKTVASNNAGNLFANLLIDHGPGGFVADSHFAGALPRALMAAEHRKPDEIAELFGRQPGDFPETWVERAFGDTRSARNSKPVNLKDMPVCLRGIAMLGLLMAGSDTVKEQTEKFRTVWTGLNKISGAGPSMAMVYGDPTLSEMEIDLDVAQEGSARISLVTLALFLHWKLAFHDQRSTVNALSILNDVTSLAGLVKLEQVANALWMMGAYLGMEHVAPTYRYLRREKYPALQFVDQEKLLEPVPAWHIKRVSPPEQEAATVSVQGIEAAETPANGLAPTDTTANSQALQSGDQERNDLLAGVQTKDTQENVPDSAGLSSARLLPGNDSPAVATVAIPGDPQTLHAVQRLLTDAGARETPGETAEQTGQAIPALQVTEIPITSGTGTPDTMLPEARDEELALIAVSAVCPSSADDTETGNVKSSPSRTKAADSGTKPSRKTQPRSNAKAGKANATAEAPVTVPAVEENPGKQEKTEERPESPGKRNAPAKGLPEQRNLL